MKRVLLALERSDDGSEAVAFAGSLVRDRKAEILLLRMEEWPLFASFAVLAFTFLYFMTVVAGTRVIPEDPEKACARLRATRSWTLL